MSNFVKDHTKRLLYFVLFTSLFISGFKSDIEYIQNDYQVIIHELSDVEGLNPYISSDAQATQIMMNLYQHLLGYNQTEGTELIPVLAKSRPEIKVLSGNTGMELTYELREEAKWDDGKPITVNDVIFSFKALKCPGVYSDANRSTTEFVTDIKTYPDDPRKFTVVCNKVYMSAEDATGTDVFIIPESVIDPKGLLKKFKINDFNDPTSAIQENDKVEEFADYYNSEEYARDPDKLAGSGAYKLASWIPGQRIVLQKKDNWYGKDVKDGNMYFEANPKKLVYETINDFTTALVELKNGKLDVMYVTPVKEYIDLDKSPKFNDNFIKSKPGMYIYSYIGMNTKDKILSDIKVRQALSQLVDVDQIIKKVIYGMGTRIVGPISPIQKDDYNNDIPLYKYDLEKAKRILKEAGWVDTDGDGILDKIINGQKTSFNITYNYNMGNPMREAVGLLMQEWYKQAGIKLDIIPLEWSFYLDELKKHKIQMFYGAWIQDPRDDDPRYIWHTESINGGSNYAAFGKAETDKMIEDIDSELDPVKRSVLYKQWQVLLHDEAPYIFLYTNNYRNVINKKFTNLHEGSRYPGYWEAGFEINQQ